MWYGQSHLGNVFRPSIYSDRRISPLIFPSICVIKAFFRTFLRLGSLESSARGRIPTAWFVPWLYTIGLRFTPLFWTQVPISPLTYRRFVYMTVFSQKNWGYVRLNLLYWRLNLGVVFTSLLSTGIRVFTLIFRPLRVKPRCMKWTPRFSWFSGVRFDSVSHMAMNTAESCSAYQSAVETRIPPLTFRPISVINPLFRKFFRLGSV